MPDRLAYTRLIPNRTRASVKVNSATHLTIGLWITLIRRADRWYVWGVSNICYRPPCTRIYARA